jgi:hypothetical protein
VRIRCRHTDWLVGLRHHGKHGVEAQFFQNEEFLRSMRFPTRKQAVHSAATERRVIEKSFQEETSESSSKVIALD